MADPELPLNGENTPIRVYVNNQPFGISDTVDSWNINEDAVIHTDQYIGRDRARFDKQVNGYDMALSADMTNTTLLAALLAQDAAREANQPIPEIAIEVQAKQRNGPIKAFVLSKVVAKWNIKSGSRVERVKKGLDLKGERIIPVAL